MRANEFLVEVKPGSRPFLYHWTPTIYLGHILKFGAIGTVDEYSPTEGPLSLKKGWISFTRDKNYQYQGKQAGGVVGFVFDQDVLRQKGYKMIPYVDRSVVTTVIGGEPLPQDQARFEAEEKVLGPVKLKDGCVSILATKSAIAYLEKHLDAMVHWRDEAAHILQQLENGTFRFSLDMMGPNASDEQKEYVAKKLADDPYWKPSRYSKEYQQGIFDTYSKDAKKTENELSILTPIN